MLNKLVKVALYTMVGLIGMLMVGVLTSIGLSIFNMSSGFDGVFSKVCLITCPIVFTIDMMAYVISVISAFLNSALGEITLEAPKLNRAQRKCLKKHSKL